jgi:hypothetical protein
MPSPAPRGSERAAGVAVLGAFALLGVLFSGLFPPYSNPNELSRFDVVYAFVETGTFAIDGALSLFPDHEDKAASGGHFYSNKAPGLAFAAIPVYRVLRVFFPSPRSPSDAIFILVRLLTVTLLCLVALGVFLLRPGGSRETPLIAFALVFGTPFLFYGRSFFSHAWTAALLLLAWDLTRRAEKRSGRGSAWLSAAAGLLAGWAAISEYSAAPLALLLAVRAASRGRWKALGAFAAGAALPFALLLAYDAACFGSVWVLSSAREADPGYADLSRRGLFGFGPPSARIALRFLFDPARGLLLRSPFWLWLVPGFLAWRRSREDRADFVFALVAVPGFFLLLTGYENWHGGWSLGNRYLLPVVFFGGLVLSRSLESPVSRSLFALAVVYSAACHFLLSASWPHFPHDVPFPAANGSLWFLDRSWFAPNLLARMGGASLLAPLAFVSLAGVLALRAARPLIPGPGIAPAGLVLFVAVISATPNPPFAARLWRATVYGLYSGRDPGREEMKSVILSARSPEERSFGIGMWARFGPKK